MYIPSASFSYVFPIPPGISLNNFFPLCRIIGTQGYALCISLNCSQSPHAGCKSMMWYGPLMSRGLYAVTTEYPRSRNE